MRSRQSRLCNAFLLIRKQTQFMTCPQSQLLNSRAESQPRSSDATTAAGSLNSVKVKAVLILNGYLMKNGAITAQMENF